MMIWPTLAAAWSAVGGAVGAAIGVVAKTYWDQYVGYQSSIPLETWKIRREELEKRLSQFYWPLYWRLKRDDDLWERVYIHPMATDASKRLASEITDKVLLPNHVAAVDIIRSNIHLANADPELLILLNRYDRHVHVFQSLRSANINADPIDVGEGYPPGLSEAVHARLTKYQSDYDELIREKGVKDFVTGWWSKPDAKERFKQALETEKRKAKTEAREAEGDAKAQR
jgi:hypothetical protein